LCRADILPLSLHDALPISHDLDALRAKAHRVLHRALHSAPEHDPLLELLGNRVGNQLRVDLRLADFLDIQADLGSHHLSKVCAQDRKSTRLNSSHEWTSYA